MTADSLRIYKYRLVLRMTTNARLPEYKGSMLRGAFGWAFRKAVCVTRQPVCTCCILQGVCSYFKVFETEVPPGTTIPFIAGVKKIPHPYVLAPPENNSREFNPGDELNAGLTLFGDTVNLLPFFVYSFQQMGDAGIGYRRDKFSLAGVYATDKNGSEISIYDTATNKLSVHEQPITLPPEGGTAPEIVTIRFITPYRAQEASKIILDPAQVTPQLLLNAAARRFFVLSALFGTRSNFVYTDPDTKDITITENKLYYKNWLRYSNRQKTKMDLGGFMGHITLAGNLAPVWQLLLSGELIHIGKNPVFGLGKYILEY